MGKILVTGALGNVGSYVVKYALENKQDVVCADISVEALQKKYGTSAKLVYFDFTDEATFNEALNDVDRVFIMRPPHLGNPEDLKSFIHALTQQKNMKLVTFLSLIGIENNPVPPHYKIEKYIEQAKLPYCHIRPSFFMQNLSGIHAFEIKHFNQIVVPVKQAITSFIDAEDIGELIAKLLTDASTHQFTAYSITGSQTLNYDEVAQILTEELQRTITYSNPKPSFAKEYWIKIRGIDKEYATVMGWLYMMTRLGTAKKTTTTFEELMGKKPLTFRQFVKKNLNAWQ